MKKLSSHQIMSCKNSIINIKRPFLSVLIFFLKLSLFSLSSGYAIELQYPVTCPTDLKIPVGEAIFCGYILVPEKHGNPGGPQIKDFFMVAKSLSGFSDLDPIFYLQGGPGGSSSEDLATILASSKLFRKNKDYVLLDQRGTGYSQPHLGCTVLVSYSESELETKLQSCDQSYRQKGIDVTAYNTVENAQDLIDLAKAMSYSSWNIMSVSYGTRLALAVMQLQPRGLRSVVLDSSSTLDPLNPVDFAKQFHQTFLHFFSACHDNPVCYREHPHLLSHYKEIIDALPRQPTDPKKFFLDSGLAITIMGEMLSGSDNSAWKEMPANIEKLYASKQAGKLNFESFKKVFPLPLHMEEGVRDIVTCYDDAGATSPEEQAQHLKEANHYYPYFQFHAYDYMSGAKSVACQAFGYGDALKPLRGPLASTVPTMLIYGKNDIFPLKYDIQIATQLPNAAIYQFAGHGHSVLSTSYCARSLVAKFYTAPNVWPVQDC
jgi:pimeloyl-ACP methyl ester carboxylesterase